MFVCVGFHAAREPSANSTRNDNDEPPWFSLKRTMGCVRTRSSSSSSDMPMNVPDASSAMRRSGSADRSLRGVGGAKAMREAAACEASTTRTSRAPRTAA